MTSLVRLHCNENPYGCSDAARRSALEAVYAVHHYPDPACTALIDAVAQRHGCAPEHVAVGNGSDELVFALVMAMRSRRRTAVTTRHTFPGYVKNLRAVGQSYLESPLAWPAVDSRALAAHIDSGAHLVFVCNPHNPCGTLLGRDGVEHLCAAAARHDAVVVFDEAYAELADPPFYSAVPAAIRKRNIVVLRTLSKAHGLAALRVGYAVGDPVVLTKLRNVLAGMPFHINAPAQRAAVAALGDEGFVEESRRRIASTRDYFYERLRILGVNAQRSQANFVLVDRRWRVGDLLDVIYPLALVRRCDDMGLPHHLRISIGNPAEMKGLISAIESYTTQRR